MRTISHIPARHGMSETVLKLPLRSYRTPTLLARILDDLVLPWRHGKPLTRRELAMRFSLKRERHRLDRVLFAALRLGALRKTPDGYVIGKGAHVDRAVERQRKIQAAESKRILSSGPFSNSFSSGSRLMTYENLKKVVAEMKAISESEQPIAIRRPEYVVPPGFAEKWRAMNIAGLRADVARAEKRARKGILSGRYGKRQRQIKMGIGAVRARKKRGASVMLPKYKQALAEAELL